MTTCSAIFNLHGTSQIHTTVNKPVLALSESTGKIFTPFERQNRELVKQLVSVLEMYWDEDYTAKRSAFPHHSLAHNESNSMRK